MQGDGVVSWLAIEMPTKQDSDDIIITYKTAIVGRNYREGLSDNQKQNIRDKASHIWYDAAFVSWRETFWDEYILGQNFWGPGERIISKDRTPGERLYPRTEPLGRDYILGQNFWGPGERIIS